MESDEIMPEIGELFDKIEVNIDENNDGIIVNDNVIRKIRFFGDEYNIYGDAKLSYVSKNKYYLLLIDVSTTP